MTEPTLTTFPAWNAATSSTGERLTMSKLRAMFDAFANAAPRPMTYILPPSVYGTSQRARRRRTVWHHGVRVELPEGSNPALFIMSDGREGWGRGPRPREVIESRYVEDGKAFGLSGARA